MAPSKPSFLFIHVNEWATIDSPDTIPVSQAYGLACLQRHGYAGQILGDYKDRPLEPGLLCAAIRENQPAVLGFSVYEENINRVRAWARYAKRLDPGLLVLLGGPQTSFMPAQGLEQMAEADILCRGEGETVLLALAQALEQGHGLRQVPGLCFKEDGRTVETLPAPLVDDLDSLPSPYLDGLIDLTGKSKAILLSSRGCTSPCTFCYTTRASRRRVRFHSIERVVAEMHYLAARGITDFWFADPNFAYSARRLTALLERIIAELPAVRFWCQTRYDLITSKMLALLKAAGAHTIAFGLESADRQVLGRIKKGLDPQKLSAVIAQVQAAGIAVELFSLFGLPGETLAQAARTLDFVKTNQVAIDGNSICQQLHLFFGTPISEDPAAHGIIPLPMTKPAYQCICRDFATKSMASAEVRQASLWWRLNRQDFRDHVEAGINLFETAGFITAHQRELAGRPEAGLLLARIYLALEEFEAAHAAILRLAENFAEDPEVRGFVAGPFVAHKIKRRGIAGPGCKVIYDCRGFHEGRPAPDTEAYYQEAVLGDGRLLPDFAEAMKGMRAGQVKQAEVVFPEDYGNQALAGKSVRFQVYLHLVLEPVTIPDAAALLACSARNIYRFQDLAALRRHNENLFYLVMRDALLRDLTQDLPEAVSLINMHLRLGFFQRAEEVLAGLPPEPALYAHLGRIYLANQQPERALQLLSALPDPGREAVINRAKALIKLERYAEAEAIVMNPQLSSDIQALDLRVGLASLLQLPVATYLARMDDLLDLQVKMMAAS